MQVREIKVNEERKEIRNHGTFEFPIAVYQTQLNKNILSFVNWHWHDELQFCLVVKGTVSVFLNQRTVTLRKGQGIFINSGVLHMSREEPGTDGTYICIDFSSRLLSSFPNSAVDRKYVLPVINSRNIDAVVLDHDSERQRDILERLQKVNDLYESGAYGYELEICSHLNMIWSDILSVIRAETGTDAGVQNDLENLRTVGGGPNQIHQQRLRDIVTYIEKHFEEPIALGDISHHVHLSVSECCRFFKKNMNCTIFDYLTEFRIGKSIGLLTETNMTVSRIAYETGFGSSSYFIEKFKSKMGMTPNAYRRKITENTCDGSPRI